MSPAKRLLSAIAACLVVVVLSALYFGLGSAIPRDTAIGKYSAMQYNGDDDVELHPDGTYAYSFRPRVGVDLRPGSLELRGGDQFTSAGRWDFEKHLTINVVILRDFSPKCAGAPEGKRDWRFTITEDSGLYRLEVEGSALGPHCLPYERPVK